MKKMYTPPRAARRAFTLIEMLVVVLILAILAALIVPRVVNRTGDAKRAKAASDIATLSSLLQQYRLDNDRFPTTEEGLNALRVQPADAANWRGPYTSKELPADPWGNEYSYEFPGPDGEDDFLIISYGADGAPGGEGDASDLTSE
ncbi:MAG TPA: type II secretion system major pseudopilin GspG [Armatimonadaceae bacterium]|jgi:general secretion pathway protein G|nr:type II secretion system major pseudopilin GspG [Armatimonadaceae bacterium]